MSARALAILKEVYGTVETLEDFLAPIVVTTDGATLRQTLKQAGDKDSYIELLETTRVHCSRERPKPLSVSQCMKLYDLVLKAIETIQNRVCAGRNVLAVGFGPPSTNLSNFLTPYPTLECHSLNPNLEEFYHSYWNILHSRIGDECMLFLLSACSLFVTFSTSYFIQVCGPPIDDLVSAQIKASKGRPQAKSEGFKALSAPNRNRKRKHGKGKQQGSVKRNQNDSNMIKDSGATPEEKSSVAPIGGKRKCSDKEPECSSSLPRLKRQRVECNDKTVKSDTSQRTPDGSQNQEGNRASEAGRSRAEKPPSAAAKKRHRRKRKKKFSVIGEEKGQAFDPHLMLNRVSLLYSRNTGERLPTNYVLKDVRCDEDGAKELLGKIFVGTNVGSSLSSVSEDDSCQKILSNLIPVFKEMIIRHKKLGYLGLLCYYCPVSGVEMSSNRRANTPGHPNDANTEKPDMAELLGSHSSHEQVFLFVRAVMQRLMPPTLFGSAHNQKVFFKNLRRLIRLGRYERMSLEMLMTGMKVTQCGWLADSSSHLRRQELLAKLLFWLASDIVMTILKAFFYVTDTAVYRTRIFYFRKAVWKQLLRLAVNGLLVKGMLKPIDKKDLRSWLPSKALGVAQMRFLPKANSLRPLVNMSGTTIVNNVKVPAVNKQLGDVERILAYCKNRDSTLLGSGKLGLDNVYQAWRDFMTSKEIAEGRQLYLVKADIERCYDSVDQKKLFNIMKDMFSGFGGAYLMRSYSKIVASSTGLKRKLHRVSGSLSDCKPRFKKFLTQLCKTKPVFDCVLVDQRVFLEDLEDVVRKLEKHIFNNVIRIGNRYYHQQCGISQGSVLSVLLCNLYYGHMERSCFTVHAEDLLLRQVDDFLLVTSNKQRATQFLKTLLTGIPEYKCYVNKQKCLTNFSCPELGVPWVNQDELFPWCGLLIHGKTLNIMSDCYRYSGINMSDAVTCDVSKNAGQAMKHKILFSMQQKCHSIYFDPKINSRETIHQNVYLICLLSAHKMQVHCEKLPRKNSVQSNPQFFLGLTLAVGRYVLTKVTKADEEVDTRRTVDDNIVKWLCFQAFCIKLKEHKAQYHKLLKLLRKHQQKIVNVLSPRTVEHLQMTVANLEERLSHVVEF